MSTKIINATDAIDLIKSNSTIVSSGFRWAGSPEVLLKTLGNKYEREKKPKNLTIVFSSAQGDIDKSNGLEHLAQKGLIKKVIGGFWGATPKLMDMALKGEIQAYNIPQGQICQMYNSIAAGAPGILSKIGLNTYVDPRFEGGCLNKKTPNDFIDIFEINKEKWLFYKSFSIDFAFLRGTTSDHNGNISIEHESVINEILPIALATHNSGGKVIAQVKKIVANGMINPKNVAVPGHLVSHVVVAQDIKNEHRQCVAFVNNTSLSGQRKVNKSLNNSNELTGYRKIIATRALKEIKPAYNVNLGQGIPTEIVSLIDRKKLAVNFTLESGVNGGIPHAVPDFGISSNPESMISQDDQFRFYNGGGLDIAFLGFAQVDEKGNVNVSKFNNRYMGCGGFMDIAQSTKKIVFCGAMTAIGLQVKVVNKHLDIINEGKVTKFVRKVDHLTFNASDAISKGQKVIYITERCVFELSEKGLRLMEIARGIDVRADILSILNFKPLISKKLKKYELQ